MVSQYQIIIKNMSGQAQPFYAVQKQATFSNSGAAPDIRSSCLATGLLAPQASSGAQLDFKFDAQNYAGVKSDAASSSLVAFNASISLAMAANTSSETSAIQPIDLTTSAPGQSVDNFSTLTVIPLGLSAPRYQPDLKAGNFGVEIPVYSPGPVAQLFCGCATINQDGSIILSCFIAPLPSSTVCCAPLPVYYVKLGDIPVGEIVPYDTTQAAKCDFTPGYRVINVQYNSDGSFTTKGS